MTNGLFRKFAIFVLLAVMAAGLSACGRRGDLQAPSAAQVQDNQSDKPAPEPAPKPDRKFILDGLI